LVHFSAMNWKRLLAYITGSVDQELLLRNEYLATENRILRKQIKGRLRLTDPERIRLAEVGRRLGRRALAEVAQIVRPETILGWHRRLIARKFDSSKNRSSAGRATLRVRRSRIWCSNSLARIGAGDTGGSLAFCAIWGTKLAARRSPMF